MPIVKVRASKILRVFEQALTELVGKALILADGTAGTVENVRLDNARHVNPMRGHHVKWLARLHHKFAQPTSPENEHTTASSP